jgi:UDP-N-acetylglucosamine acyltransferase
MRHIDETARIDPKAELGDDVVVGPYSVINKGAVVGDRTTIGPHVVIHECTSIGADNEIHASAQLGGTAQTLSKSEEETYLQIGDGNTIREFVTISRGFFEETGRTTRVGNKNFLMACTHIGHDCTVGDRVVMSNYVGLSGHVTLEDDCVIGGLTGVHQFCRVGRLAFVGGATRLTKDAPPFMWVIGDPAECYGLNTEGLRRNGIDKEARHAIKQAFKILFRSGMNAQEALSQVREQLGGYPEAAYLADFVEGSQRGVARARSRKTR